MQVKAGWEKSKLAMFVGDEDIHTANERRLSVHVQLVHVFFKHFYQTEVVMYNYAPIYIIIVELVLTYLSVLLIKNSSRILITTKFFLVTLYNDNFSEILISS